MPNTRSPESLRILCLDGGGIKGYTSLLILKRILRTMMVEGQLEEIPRPCNVFDLITGTSTGGLIAVMLGRLHMTIDECILKYEQVGGKVFGKRPHGGKVGKMLKGLRSSTFYDIAVLQEEVRKVLDSQEIPRTSRFQEPVSTSCRVMLCVTRAETSKPDVLRSYEALDPTAENYSCNIWEAASATAAAPMYFKGVQFDRTGEKWCDGGLRRNNPVNEALSELSREPAWKDKKIGCVLSIGTGVAKSDRVSSNLAGVLKSALAIMTDSDDIARVFSSSEKGIELFRTHRYYRFSVPQGMQDLQLDEWKETEKMRALTTDYLAHVSNGDMITQCAKALLDPDENLQVDIKSNQSLIPYQPCTHFVERRVYSDILIKFFRSRLQVVQTFVLWGLGGTGKTQIALRFAQSVRHRLSIFWIRADNFANFATDYSQILGQLQSQDRLSHENDDLPTILGKTKRILEESAQDWLLILDNADNLDDFLGRAGLQSSDEQLYISRFLPRQGRMLITTRDRRFQGTVVAASDGQKVDSMNEEEAKQLLFVSIPGYLVRDESESERQAQQLIRELGYLPLAIAQAAANILDQQLTLAEYVSFYQFKKQRMGLMQAPALDFQTTDSRNASQSVNITWQMSFDVLKEKHPLSARLFAYLGCFHWRNVPRLLLQRLPEFRELPDAAFIQLSKKPLNLSLFEEMESEPGYVEYMVHPLVHENILNHESRSDVTSNLEMVAEVLVPLFQSVQDKKHSAWSLTVYLAPHIARIAELCEEVQLSTQLTTILFLKLSQFYGTSSIFSLAVDLAEKARKMAQEVWRSDPSMVLLFVSNLNRQYEMACRLGDAERTAREALEWLNSDIVQENMVKGQIEIQRIGLQSDLASSLTRPGGHAERELLHRDQISSGRVDPWNAKGINIRHNLAHALHHQQKYDQAKLINNELLEFAKTEAGGKEVTRRLYLIMLNLRCQILRTVDPAKRNDAMRLVPPPMNISVELREELRAIHMMVLTESVEQLGFEDVDTWKAINNMCGFLSFHSLQSESPPILKYVLKAGIEADVKAEGHFRATLINLTSTAKEIVELLELSSFEQSQDPVEYRNLWQDWIESIGLTEGDLVSNHDRDHVHFNNEGALCQRKGRYQEAERLAVKAIEICTASDVVVPEVYRYNLMLVIGRQGRVQDALEYREQYREAIGRIESTLGTLEMRLEADRSERDLYDQAQALLDKGRIVGDGDWWRIHEEVLRRMEIRHGKLRQLQSQPADIGKKTGVFGFRFRRSR